LSTDQRIAGRVVTVKLANVEGAASTRALCVEAMELAHAGDVIVCEQRTGIDAACWGGNLTIAAQMRGVAGAIVEGPARDLDECRQLGFPVFARAITGRAARGRVIDVATNVPIQVGDVTVHAGDYVLADASCVAFIAQADIERVVSMAESIWQRDLAIAQALREGSTLTQAQSSK
jgi:4-hydroxy-4-methyl-2-oxoglutarate aldolase